MFATTVACVKMFVLVLVGWSVPVGSGFVPLSSFGPTPSDGKTPCIDSHPGLGSAHGGGQDSFMA